MQDFFYCKKIYLLVVALFAAAVMLPMLAGGLPRGYDFPHHLQCALTYYDALKSGDFLPSWTLQRNFGYGAVELRMYPPLSHFVWALIYAAVGDWQISLWLSLVLWTAIGGYGVYFFAREYLAASLALIAAVFFIVQPYNLHRIYLIFLYSDYVAGTILPFCFLFVLKIARQCKDEPFSFEFSRIWLNVCGLIISLSALILTHLPSTIIGGISLVIFAACLLRPNLNFCRRFLLCLCAAAATALATTAFFWVKVLQERWLLAKDLIYPDIHVRYEWNFLLTLIQTYSEQGFEVYSSVTNFVDLLLLATLSGFALTLPMLFAKRREASQKQNLTPLWIASATALFFSIILSKPVWDAIKILQELQFPWRWLTILVVMSPILMAAGVPDCHRWLQNENKRPIALLLVGCWLFGLTFTFTQIMRPAVYIPHSQIAASVAAIESKESFTFWWTKWTRREIFQIKDKVLIENRQIKINDWMTTYREFSVAAGEADAARISVFYYPNWQATANGAAIETRPDADGALLLLNLPKEAATVRVFFRETLAAQIARGLSLFVWILLSPIVLWLLWKRWKSPSGNENVNLNRRQFGFY
jgi:hypothetical protein